jgi:hypothetical protein
LNSRPPDYESGALPLSYCGRYALERTRTAMPFGTTPSRWRVYQFHHQGNTAACCLPLAAGSQRTAASRFNTGPTGLEPATSRVTVECSNQTELRPQLWSQGRKPLPHYASNSDWLSVNPSFASRLPPPASRFPPPASRLPPPASRFPPPAIAPRGIEPLSAP